MNDHLATLSSVTMFSEEENAVRDMVQTWATTELTVRTINDMIGVIPHVDNQVDKREATRTRTQNLTQTHPHETQSSLNLSPLIHHLNSLTFVLWIKRVP